MKIFKNRQAAGKLLAKRLKQFKAREDTVVLSIPRGGVVVAKEIARSLKLPLDILVTRKIGAPFQSELALGAVDADGDVVWDEALLEETRVSKDELEDIIGREVEEIKRREEVYRGDRKPLDFSGKVVILVDDGLATGSTILAALRFLKMHRAKKIVLAVPVASKESINKVEKEIDEVVILDIPEFFQAVGQFYQDFKPISDQEVVSLLK